MDTVEFLWVALLLVFVLLDIVLAVANFRARTIVNLFMGLVSSVAAAFVLAAVVVFVLRGGW